MSISFYTFVISFAWLNVFILLCALMKRSTNFIMRFGFSPIIFLMVAGVIRFFFAVEFRFTQVVHFGVLTDIQLYAREDAFTASGYTVTRAQVLLLIWLIIASVFVIRIFIDIARQKKALARLHTLEDSRVRNVLDTIAASYNIRNYILVVTDDIDVPYMTGFFRPTILIPSLNMSDEELDLVIRHELHHYLHHDIWIKLFINIFCAIFFWNPLVYILKNDLDLVLEMRCDHSVTKEFDDLQKVKYVEATLNVVKQAGSQRSKFPVCAAGLVSTKDSEKVVMRFKQVLKQRKRVSFFVKSLMICLTFCIMVVSYAFVLQPAGYPDEPDDGIVEITTENSYIKFEDGIYTLYVNDEAWFIVSENDVNAGPLSKLPIIK